MKKIVLVACVLLLCLAVFGGSVSCGVSERNKTYTVRFVTGFSDVTVDDLVVDGKEPAVMPSDPVKVGYDFLGWFYDEEKTLPFSIGEDPLPVARDLTLYAGWKKLGGGSTDPEQPTEREGGLLYEKWGEEYAVVGYDGEEKTVVVPKSYKGIAVVAVADGAFSGCGATKIRLGGAVKHVGEGAFRDLPDLTEIAVDGNNAYFLSDGGVLYTAGKTSLVAVPQKVALSTLTLPTSAKGIADYALEGCTLTLVFPAGEYDEIGEYDLARFAGAVTVNKNVKTICRHAFDGATCEVTFSPDCGVTSLPMQAFENYAGSHLALPGTVQEIEPYAFAGCMAEVDLSALGLTEISERLLGRYQGERFVVPATVRSIARYAFAGATCEVTFAFGSQYSEVVDYAFASFGTAEKGGKVTLPSEISSLPENAFWNSYCEIAFEDGRDTETILSDLKNYRRKTAE